jgi:hypothetical protein
MLDRPLEAVDGLPGTYLMTGETGFEIEAANGRTLTVRNYPFVGGETVTIPLGVYLENHGGL